MFTERSLSGSAKVTSRGYDPSHLSLPTTRCDMAHPAARRAPASRIALAAAVVVMLVYPGVATAAGKGAGAQPGPAAQAEPQSQRTVDVQILSLNETHGQLVPLRRQGRFAGGAAVLAAYLEREEAEHRRTLIIDTGDFMQGPAISSYFRGEPAVEVFNEIDVDATAVGNHEFDRGQQTLQQRIAQANFRSWP